MTHRNRFTCFATQNPLEQEGTYPLPEAQLDRFLMQIDVDYPDREAERDILLATTGAAKTEIDPVLTTAQLTEAQQIVRAMPIGEEIVSQILTLVRALRPYEADDPADLSGAFGARVDQYVAFGPGPRASQSLVLCAKARAFLDGRYAPSPDDVAALARPVLKHRLALHYKARADGLDEDKIIDEAVRTLNETNHS